MLVWVASQSALVIGLLCFVWSYLMCGAVYAAVRFAARRGHGAAFKVVAYDRPFGGGVSVTPAVLKDVLPR